MCTSIVEVVGADGAGKGGDGWFDVTHAVVSYDHPHHALYEDAINIDFVNLGFSGNGKGEPEMAEAVSQIDASCYVLDFAQNNGTVASLREVYGPFLDRLRKAHPDTPILAITPIFSTRETSAGSGNEGMREHIRQVVSQRIGAGDRNLQLVEGTDLLPESLRPAAQTACPSARAPLRAVRRHGCVAAPRGRIPLADYRRCRTGYWRDLAQ